MMQRATLIKYSNLQEIGLHETSKRAALKEQTLIVRGTPCFIYI